MKDHYQSGVRISDRAVYRVIKVTVRQQNNRYMPRRPGTGDLNQAKKGVV